MVSMRRTASNIAIAWLLLATHSFADDRRVEVFTDKDSWLTAVGEVTTIGFNDYPSGTIITDQYDDAGLTVSGASPAFILGPCPETFLEDGFALNIIPDPLYLGFSEGMHWIGVDFPGVIVLELYAGDEYIGGSGIAGQEPVGNFVGIVSTRAFNSVTALDVFDELVVVDDLHFGPPVQTPLPGDANGDGAVDVADLIDVILAWGDCRGQPCPADLTGDGVVDVHDLIEVVVNWT